jgi:hypothetical protein
MSAAPQRNFELPLEERLRAIVSGPPAFARRLRAIEDLEEAIVQGLAKLARKGEAAPVPAAAYRRLTELVGAHNRFYPIESNLPMCLRTGELLDRDGTPWRPRRCPSTEELIARARRRLG